MPDDRETGARDTGESGADEARSTGDQSTGDRSTDEQEDDHRVEEYFARSSADAARTALPPKVEAWRKRSATGAILTGFAFGLREALEPERDEPSIMMETSGAPPKDLPVEADLAEMHPRRSVVRIRPWLLNDDSHAATGTGEDGAPADDERTGDERTGDEPADHESN